MSTPTRKKDRLFAEQVLPGDFEFDKEVAEVFEDMISRSVPGYTTILDMIAILAENYIQENSKIYDLGCSLGGATFAITRQLPNIPCSIVAIDKSSAMIDRMEKEKASLGTTMALIECHCEDILNAEIFNASVVVLNFTLQFVQLSDRQRLIEKIFAGMNPGGILIVSEKIRFPDDKLNSLFTDMHHGFKGNRGYSKLEISQKRSALENVLIPETIDTHRSRLTQAGFSSFDVWFQCFNFASMVVFK